MNKSYILIFVISLFLFSCTDPEEKKNHESFKVHDKKDCNIRNLTINESASVNDKVDTLIDPVAITFFNLNKLILKYDEDSLPERFRQLGQQEIYRTIDINGIYSAIIEPRLDTLSIKKIDSGETLGYLIFKTEEGYYAIDKGQYKERDGVLLFNGRDKPIFWTEGVNCDPDNLVQCYFKNKNCP